MFPKNEDNKASFILMGFLYVAAVFYTLHVGKCLSDGLIGAIFGAFTHIEKGPLNIFPISMATLRLLGLVTLGFIIFAVYSTVNAGSKQATQFAGSEYGNAKFQTKSDIAKFNKKYNEPFGKTSTNGTNNVILGNEVYLSLDGRKTQLNSNVLIMGGAGSGKSRGYVEPNVLQMNTSYVITDPSGEILKMCGHALEENGYKIKVFNLTDMAHSDCYNPFEYIRDEQGVLTLIECLMKNTKDKDAKGGDPFWDKSESALLQALVFYLVKHRSEKEYKNFTYVLNLMMKGSMDENATSTESPLDAIFKLVKEHDPESIAVKSYEVYKQGGVKTLKSVLMTASVRLQPFNIPAISNLTSRDTLDLKSIGDEKTALFIIIPQATSSLNFLAAMMYYQLFETLYFHAESETPNKRLPIPVHFILDEFANIGQIPEFDKKLATMRKYGIFCSIILQNISQIKSLYRDDWGTIVGNCDSVIFLGGKEPDTLKYISDMMGNATIVAKNTSKSRSGKGGSSSTSNNKMAKLLASPADLAQMDTKYSIVLISHQQPFYTKKYILSNHPNYKLTAEKNPDFAYKIQISNNKRKDIVDLDKLREAAMAERAKKSATATREQDKEIGSITTPKETLETAGILTPDDAVKQIKSVMVRPEQEDSNAEGNTTYSLGGGERRVITGRRHRLDRLKESMPDENKQDMDDVLMGSSRPKQEKPERRNPKDWKPAERRVIVLPGAEEEGAEEKPVRKPVEAPAERPSEADTEKPVESRTGKPMERPAGEAATTPKEAPAPKDPPAEKPQEKPPVRLEVKPEERPMEKPVDSSRDRSQEKPRDIHVEKPKEAARKSDDRQGEPKPRENHKDAGTGSGKPSGQNRRPSPVYPGMDRGKKPRKRTLSESENAQYGKPGKPDKKNNGGFEGLQKFGDDLADFDGVL